jgi:Glycosyltransferase family 87
LALAFFWEQKGNPLISGLALGLMLYKPTLVILLLPMLVVARRWWTLLGVCLTGLFLSLISLVAAGKNICLSYMDALQGFTGTTTGTGMVRKDWKFIDLNFFFRNLFGEPTPLGRILVLTIAVAMLIFLFISWWNMDRGGESRRWLVWAGTVTSTMVVNVYMGIYDLILIVPAVLWTAEVFYRQPNRTASYFPTFKLLVFLVIVLSWITQPLARVTGVQIITLVLLALAAFQLRLSWIMTENAAATIPNSVSLSKTAICQ